MSNIVEEITYVYLTTNLVNNKQYVGQHTTSNVDDSYLGSGVLLFKAIKKYGKKSFKRDIIEICTDIEDAYLKEEYYIKYYDTLQPQGYNISPKGGAHGTGSIADSTKEKIRNIRIGGTSWMSFVTEDDPRVIAMRKKFKLKEENKPSRSAKLSYAHSRMAPFKQRNSKGQFSNKEPQTGEGVSPESRNKMSKSRLGMPSVRKGVKVSMEYLNNTCLSILQYDLEMNLIHEWQSRREAADTLGISAKTITEACGGFAKTYRGFIWKYKNPPQKTEIHQKTLDGKLINKWQNTVDAFKGTGVKGAAINYNLRGETKTAGGYIWEKILIGNE